VGRCVSFSSGWRPWSCTCATLPRAAAIVGRGGGWCCSLVLRKKAHSISKAQTEGRRGTPPYKLVAASSPSRGGTKPSSFTGANSSPEIPSPRKPPRRACQNLALIPDVSVHSGLAQPRFRCLCAYGPSTRRKPTPSQKPD
jgi:hypothetical protein